MRDANAGAFIANRAKARCRSGATSTSARLRSMAVTTPLPTCSGVPVPIKGGGGAPDSAYIPASRMAPGQITETPTPAGCMSSRRHSAKPAARISLRHRAMRRPLLPCRTSTRRRRMPRPSRRERGDSARVIWIGDSRLTRSARSIWCGVKLSSSPMPVGRHWRRGRRYRRPRPAARGVAPSSARSVTIVRWPCPASEPASRSSSCCLRELRIILAPRSASAEAIACPESAGGAVGGLSSR